MRKSPTTGDRTRRSQIPGKSSVVSSNDCNVSNIGRCVSEDKERRKRRGKKGGGGLVDIISSSFVGGWFCMHLGNGYC